METPIKNLRNALLGQLSSSSSEFGALTNGLWKPGPQPNQSLVSEEPCCVWSCCVCAICELKQKKGLFSYTFSLIVLLYGL